MKKHLTKIMKSSIWIANGVILGMFFTSMNSKPTPSVIEADKFVVKSPDGKPSLILDASDGVAKVSFFGLNHQIQMQLIGGASPSISMKDKDQKEMMQISLIQDGGVVFALKDKAEVSRLQLQGGVQPALFLKNERNDIIATLLTIQDGGAAFGLGDKDGDVAAFLRGGATPSISFFEKSIEPSVALGISKHVPHLLVSSPSTKDNLVLHGGEPTSLLFVDDKGDIPVLLSKHGLFQGKKQQTQSESSSEEKIFTWDDLINPLEDIKLHKR